jgi:hypothetical protein
LGGGWRRWYCGSEGGLGRRRSLNMTWHSQCKRHKEKHRNVYEVWDTIVCCRWALAWCDRPTGSKSTADMMCLEPMLQQSVMLLIILSKAHV